MRLTKLKRKTKKALAASARANYDQKLKGFTKGLLGGNEIGSVVGEDRTGPLPDRKRCKALMKASVVRSITTSM